MQAYICSICGYLYDIESAEKDKETGKPIPFTDLPSDWVCPNCGVSKDFFVKTDSDRTPDKISEK